MSDREVWHKQDGREWMRAGHGGTFELNISRKTIDKRIAEASAIVFL